MLLLQCFFYHPRDPSDQPVMVALGELSCTSHHPLGATAQLCAQGESSSAGCPHQRKQTPESEQCDEKPPLCKPEARLSNVSMELPHRCSTHLAGSGRCRELRALRLLSAWEVESEVASL